MKRLETRARSPTHPHTPARHCRSSDVSDGTYHLTAVDRSGPVRPSFATVAAARSSEPCNAHFVPPLLDAWSMVLRHRSY